jgi:hypothetical protein
MLRVCLFELVKWVVMLGTQNSLGTRMVQLFRLDLKRVWVTESDWRLVLVYVLGLGR